MVSAQRDKTNIETSLMSVERLGLILRIILITLKGYKGSKKRESWHGGGKYSKKFLGVEGISGLREDPI